MQVSWQLIILSVTHQFSWSNIGQEGLLSRELLPSVFVRTRHLSRFVLPRPSSEADSYTNKHRMTRDSRAHVISIFFASEKQEGFGHVHARCNLISLAKGDCWGQRSGRWQLWTTGQTLLISSNDVPVGWCFMPPPLSYCCPYFLSVVWQNGWFTSLDLCSPHLLALMFVHWT